MVSISQLRNVVNKGWTIANRKILQQQIGQKQYKELVGELGSLKQLQFDCFDLLNPTATFDLIKLYKSINIDYMDIVRKSISEIKEIKTWSRVPNFEGTPHLNSEFYIRFKNTYQGKPVIIIDEHKPTRIRKLFDSLDQLGVDRIHYRGECYYTPEGLAHFEKLSKLKAGDIYSPHSNLWVSDNKNYAFRSYGMPVPGNPNSKAVQYEILCPQNAKIIEAKYDTVGDGKGGLEFFSEGIYDDRTKLKIIDTVLDGDILKLKCEMIPHVNITG